MINTTLKELLKAYQESNPETTTLKLSNIEHLVMNEVIQMPYFKEAVSDLNGSEKNDLYIDEFENIVFYNGRSSLSTISKDDFVHGGGYVLTRSEADRLSVIQDIVENATCLNDLVGVFTEEDPNLVQKFSVDLPTDELFSMMCMAKLRENINNNPDYELTYDEIYGKTMMRVYIEKGCSLDKDFKYSLSQDVTMRKHLVGNVATLTQDDITIGTLKGMVREENKTLVNIFSKYIIDNPDADNSDHKTTYSDLSPVLNNPMIKNNTVIGIVLDNTLSGPEKLMKLYEKRYFDKAKVNFSSTLEFQINKLTLEDLKERYSNAVETIVQKLESEYPLLNSRREETFYSEKSDFNYSRIFETTRNKDGLLSRDYLENERTLINATMDSYFFKKLENVHMGLVDKHRTDVIKLTHHEVVGYHNNIESTLMLRLQSFKEHDAPVKGRPNIAVLSMISFPRALADHSFDMLSVFLKEQEKLGVNVIINLKEVASYVKDYTPRLEALKKHPNVVLCDYPTLENKLNKMLEAFHMYDIKNDFLTSEQKTSLLLTGLKRIETEIPQEVNSYNYEGGQKIMEFMGKLIKEELPKLGNHHKIDNTFK